MSTKLAEEIRAGETLLIAGRFRVTVIGVKANDYGVEEGVTLYTRGADGLTDTYTFEAGAPVAVTS